MSWFLRCGSQYYGSKDETDFINQYSASSSSSGHYVVNPCSYSDERSMWDLTSKLSHK